MADYTPLDEAGDALDGVAVAVAGTIDDAVPLARLKVHLEHLPKERLPRIAALALELTDLLDVSIDTYADTSYLSYVVRAHGTRELAQQRARGCRPCRESAPRWRLGVCRVCGGLAFDRKAYFCSEEHRLQDARAGHP